MAYRIHLAAAAAAGIALLAGLVSGVTWAYAVAGVALTAAGVAALVGGRVLPTYLGHLLHRIHRDDAEADRRASARAHARTVGSFWTLIGLGLVALALAP